MKTIRQVAVLGAGTMGARIAAHFANAGIPALLLDIVPPNQPNRNAAAQKGIENAAKLRPAGFFVDAGAALVKPGNFEDHLDLVAGCDWIIEAVTENLDIKRSLWTKVLAVAKKDAILSTNTSGIPLAKISEGWPSEARQRFLGTHFFNPPRYLHLLEVIPGAETTKTVLDFVSDFGDRKLGKGIVPCKDTPNFIANRIGSFWGGTVGKITREGEYTVEEVDYITGPLVGVPGTASFRLLDLVGLDVWGFVGENLYHAVPDDPWRDRFLTDPAHKQMMANGWLGDKSGQGYYKKVGPAKEIHAINLKTLEYAPIQKVKYPAAEEAKQLEDMPARLRKLVAGTDRVGSFLWSLYSDLFIYCAERIPEVSDRCVEIDRAMKWGYKHKYGPFELWDALGFEAVCKRLEAEKRNIPVNIEAMRKAGATSFYASNDSGGNPGTKYFDLGTGAFAELEARKGVAVIADLKRARGVVKSNPGASLMDLGDGVACVEFHSKMNSLGEDNFQMMQAGLEALDSGSFEALVIANQGQDFCVGANLALVLMGAQEEEWEELNMSIHRFQQLNMRLKYASKPIVVAPFARTLGGGCEIQLHGAKVQAAAEVYMGLVEVGVGLIPGGGGTKELIARLKDPRKCFELIGMAKVSSSADDAKAMGLLARDAGISMNTERLIADAKEAALALVPGYTAPNPKPIKVGGAPVKALLNVGLWSMRQGGYISDYDVEVGKKLANILSGGNLSGESEVSEQYLLDLEREAFLSLCGAPKTQERMAHMLKTGKPLRN